MFESEVVTITGISNAGKTLTFEPKLKYKHFSGVETYTDKWSKTWDVKMRAEVGCLTRNIVI